MYSDLATDRLVYSPQKEKCGECPGGLVWVGIGFPGRTGAEVIQEPDKIVDARHVLQVIGPVTTLVDLAEFQENVRSVRAHCRHVTVQSLNKRRLSIVRRRSRAEGPALVSRGTQGD